MHANPELTRARARRLLDAFLRPAVYGAAVGLGVEALHVHGAPIGVAQARAGRFEPFAVGDRWGAPWDTTWLRLRGSVPAEWAGAEVVARIGLGFAGQTGFGAEALLWRGDTAVQGISPDHSEVLVARPARGGEAVDLLVEAAANPDIDQRAATWPLLMPDPGGAPILELRRAELCVARRDVEALCIDMELVLDLASHLEPERARTGVLVEALRRACMLVDPEALTPANVAAAQAPLHDALSNAGAPRRFRVVAQGHAHIDTAWLWPLRESRRKCARSFSTVLSLMDEDPDLRFAASQMVQYAWMRDDHPELFARIRQRVAEGRWEVVGGMWVEADCNVASAESLVRQVLHGVRFAEEELGVRPRVGWLPDTFGFPATLPQILAQSGFDSFMTQKLWWNDTDTFPHSTFWWEGGDGSRVLTHMPPVATYNGVVSAEEVLRSETSFHDSGVSSSSLYLFGLGDGGGGPTREMLLRARRLGDVDGLPQLEQGTSGDFFARVAAEDGERLATWRGELYLERHRGVFTTQARIKRDNRQAERLLREAETWSALRPDGIGEYPAAALDEAWKLTLLHQFHDILPGSSIHWVYQDAARDHARVHRIAEDAIDTAVQAIAARVDTTGMARPVVVFNAASASRAEMVEIDGNLHAVEVPAIGYAAIDAAARHAHADRVAVGGNSMENGLLRITWDGDGLLTSIHDKQAAREVIADGARANLLQVFRDHPTDYDAWEVDADDLRTPTDITACDRIEVIERGPARAAVRVTRSHGASTYTQTIALHAGSRRVDFHTRVDWQESHRLLKVAFPVAVRAEEARYDTGFGSVARPTHENTTWDAARFEVPAHRWADLSQADHGVALLNRDKHGHDVRGNTMRLTLLRAPTAPDPQADRGVHDIEYALLPHRGDAAAAQVACHAEAYDIPLRAVPTTAHQGDLPATGTLLDLHVDGQVLVTAVKKSERGEALVVRVCEVAGGGARIVANRPAALCDLLENPHTPLDGATTLGPHQLATLRFEPAS
ncbi:MAG TPA: glycoside hydrolase family 38 C-terminal domain-containing protein [Candidatus Angelobacter sp.]|nr:glycoside hydrolase family 38 C-terminal domain-containing protein [Candidatus Angelobacter sp.]